MTEAPGGRRDRWRRAIRAVVALVDDAHLSLTSRPGRTTAMMAGILLGVASAVGAIAVADTQQARIDRQFDAQRSGHVVLQAQQPTEDPFDRRAIEAAAALEPVTAVGELSIWREHITLRRTAWDDPESAPLVVADQGGLWAADAVVAGLPLTAATELEGAPVVWLGARLAERLGVGLSGAHSVRIGGRTHSVVGLVDAGSGFGYLRTSVVVPRGLAMARYGNGESVRLVAAVRPGSAAAVGDHLRASLDPARSLRLVDATPPDGERLRGDVASDLRRVGIGLGLFVGFVGMVAVANTLSMSVHQRSRELGLRSAIGWSRRRIAGLILIESAAAGVVAAVVGAGLGLGGAAAWAALSGWTFVVHPWLALAAVAGGTLFSVLGGAVPAYRAASVSPLTAMRA